MNWLEIEHAGAVHRIVVKRVAAARRYTLRVRAAQRDVVMTLPSHGSFRAAKVFAIKHADWITARLAALEPRIVFAPGIAVPLRGRPHRITHRPGLRTRVWVEDLSPDAEPALCVSGTPSQLERHVLAFLRSEARRDLVAAVERHAAYVGKAVAGLTLRDTKSRWGSCTARGTLNFSWRMILAPSFVLDYLAAHEVAHLVHLNHSQAFWATARQLAPRIDEAERWLKANGATLHHYGV